MDHPHQCGGGAIVPVFVGGNPLDFVDMGLDIGLNLDHSSNTGV